MFRILNLLFSLCSFEEKELAVQPETVTHLVAVRVVEKKIIHF
jgi:hypothetical protein